LVGALLLVAAWLFIAWRLHRGFHDYSLNDKVSAAICWGWPLVILLVVAWLIVAALFFVIELAAGSVFNVTGRARRAWFAL